MIAPSAVLASTFRDKLSVQLQQLRVALPWAARALDLPDPIRSGNVSLATATGGESKDGGDILIGAATSRASRIARGAVADRATGVLGPARWAVAAATGSAPFLSVGPPDRSLGGRERLGGRFRAGPVRRVRFDRPGQRESLRHDQCRGRRVLRRCPHSLFR
jgi:hypothetical protein